VTDEQIIARAREAAKGRRPADFIRVLQGLAPHASRIQLAVYLKRSVETMPLSAIKSCGDWRGFGGSMSDEAVDAEMMPFMPPAPFDSPPLPLPWTAGRPGGPRLPDALDDLLRTDSTPATWHVIADWLERDQEGHAGAFRSAAHWAQALTRDGFGLRATRTLSGHALHFRWVAPGRFRMGDSKRADQLLHTVTLTRGAWIAETPITQQLWTDAAIPVQDVSHYRSPTRPVHGLSWDDAQQTCTWLSAQMGVDACLPTEAEWECACRAGTATQTWRGDLNWRGPQSANNLPILDAIAWYSGNCGVDFDLQSGHDLSSWRGVQHPQSRGGVRAVGQKQPNPLGLYDMLGNVAEWCADWYGQYQGDATDPAGPERGNERVLRGGMWNTTWMMAAERWRKWPQGRHPRGLFATALRPVIRGR
jgi:formylglycine-generating enzyme required for sulfatase activity